MHYRLRYADIVRLAEVLQRFPAGRIPCHREKWDVVAILSIWDGLGGYIFVIDETQPEWGVDAVEALAGAILETWS